MNLRFDITTETPDLYTALGKLNSAVTEAGLEPRLIHLLKIRVSQINGCAFCVDMHVKEALSDGIKDLTLHHLAVWRETNSFTPRERAVLAWAETLTLLAGSPVEDAEYEAARAELSNQEMAILSVAVAMINLWNRIGVGANMSA